MLVGMLRRDIRWIIEDITKVAEHVGLAQSNLLYNHLENLVLFDKKLVEIAMNINRNKEETKDI